MHYLCSSWASCDYCNVIIIVNKESRVLKFWFSPDTEYFDRVTCAYEFFKELVRPENFPRGNYPVSCCLYGFTVHFIALHFLVYFVLLSLYLLFVIICERHNYTWAGVYSVRWKLIQPILGWFFDCISHIRLSSPLRRKIKPQALNHMKALCKFESRQDSSKRYVLFWCSFAVQFLICVCIGTTIV